MRKGLRRLRPRGCFSRPRFGSQPPRHASMSQLTQPQAVSPALSLRVAVAYLGEKSQAGWWDSEFLSITGAQYLRLIYPKTSAHAAVTAATEAARRIHDERIGRGRVAHLFRLPGESNGGVLALDELSKLCVPDAAKAVLAELAGQTRVPASVGPIQIGSLDDAKSDNAIKRLAGVYRTAFEAGTPVFPYFA